MKKILVGMVVVLAVLAGGAYFLSANMDTVVRAAIETYGTAAAKTSVRLDAVKLALATGEAALEGLSVGNPEGFEAEPSIFLGKIAVTIDTHSLPGTNPIIIKDITIEKPQITYEVNATGESNLQKLTRNAQAFGGSIGGKKKAEAAPAATSQPPARKIIINNLTIRDGEISISQAMLQGKKITAALPVIHMTNIGKDEGGATASEIAQKLLAVITANASQVSTASLAKELGATLNNAQGGIAGGLPNSVKRLLGN